MFLFLLAICFTVSNSAEEQCYRVEETGETEYNGDYEACSPAVRAARVSRYSPDALCWMKKGTSEPTTASSPLILQLNKAVSNVIMPATARYASTDGVDGDWFYIDGTNPAPTIKAVPCEITPPTTIPPTTREATTKTTQDTYTENGATCHFPFHYCGKWHDSCQPYYGKTWCSTTKNYEGSWGYCTDVKPQPPNSDIEERVKGYIESGTCSRASASSPCGDLSTHYYKEFLYKGKRVIITSGIPDHPAEDGALKRNPNTRCPVWRYVQLPLAPSKSATGAISGMGSIGIAVTGAYIFNDLRDPSGALALPEEADTFDNCNAHSSPFKEYHYHANMNCTTSSLLQGTRDPDVCALFGYYYDGVPVYAFCRDSNGKQMTSCYKLKSGRSTVTAKMINGDQITAALQRDDYEYSASEYASGACNLDIASGAIHPTTKQYSYFTTPTYPWIPIYHHAGTAVRPCSAN